MCIGDFITAKFQTASFKSAFSHLGTERTWIGFLTGFKENLADFRRNDRVGHV